MSFELGMMAAAGETGGSFWMPPEISTSAAGVDWIFYFIFWISLFFFLLIVGLMTYFVVRYRRPKGVEAEGAPSHNMVLEVTWSVIPLILVIVIFYLGFKGFMDLFTSPQNAYEVLVTGQKWKWLFQYPNGYVDENLHVPVDVPVRLVMSSEDVIHSLYIPAFRVKRDVVPGRYTKAWFQATQAGDYQIFCAEYCGKSHSDMLAKVVVEKPGDFEKWLEKASNFLDTMPPAEAGARLYKTRGCAQCHSIDGTSGIGPTFKGVFGETVVMVGGAKVAVDENYLRESINEPQVRVVAGYQPVMPTFKGRLKDKEITAIIEYIKSLER
ncbi:MAG: cytochrome c oxidase subunit II [Acidobacteria bacterium]|nr:cytochrome c oxidase subunit II [Acidobacteriota bacterium]